MLHTTVVNALGGTMIRAHTLGVSTGNPLSMMPTLGEVNEQAFDTIDWAVYQAREYGVRLLIPLTDDYVCLDELEIGHYQLSMGGRIIIMVENTTFCVGMDSTSPILVRQETRRSCNFTPTPPSLAPSKTISSNCSRT